jgi:hypothetical protein
MDDCLDGRPDGDEKGQCRMVAATDQFKARRRPTGFCGNAGPVDEDAGNYQAVARMYLDDPFTR